MKKMLVLILLVVLTMAFPVFSADFKVRTVNEHTRQAVLVDRDTGAEWLVGEGDHIDGSIVREVRRSYVTIITPVDEHRAVVVMIPAMNEASPAQTAR